MMTDGGKLQRDVEKGDPSPPPGGRNEEMVNKYSYVLKLLSFPVLYKFFEEKGEAEDEDRLWKEAKKIWMVAVAIMSCNAGVIGSASKADGSLAQGVLILTTLSFLLTLFLIVSPIAMPTFLKPKIKRFLLNSGAIITACSFLIYVATKMGSTITPTTILAIFISALFITFITLLFLIKLILPPPPHTPILPYSSSTSSSHTAT